MSPETLHLRPHEPVAERVLLPGDPGRALRLAQQLITGMPKMLNHNRGLWGYSGIASDGHPLTVQATGMGGPSAAIVVEELVMLGARRLLRVGTCGALDPSLALGRCCRSRPRCPRTARAARSAPPAHCGPTRSCTARCRHRRRRSCPPTCSTTPTRSVPTAGARPARSPWRWRRRRCSRSPRATACPRRACSRSSDIVATRERIGPEALLEAEEELGRVAFAALS